MMWSRSELRERQHDVAKRQTRRSISITGKTYRRLQAKCIREGVSISGWLEQAIAPHIEGIPDPGPRTGYPTQRDESPCEVRQDVEDLRALEAAFGGGRFSG
jgi:hypothetical protein